tara:strand:+ start:10 stop:459 length:450 start_codon:yes stop_codon:yes gene_type:complete
MTDIPSWTQYFMDLARLVATKSKDSTQVGAILVGPDGEVRLTGYNGPPKGVIDRPERRDRPAKYLYVSHAEQNLIAFAARVGIPTKGCDIYVTHHPCSNCAKTLIQAGIKTIVIGGGTTSMPPEEFRSAEVMFRESGVSVSGMPPGDTK